MFISQPLQQKYSSTDLSASGRPDSVKGASLRYINTLSYRAGADFAVTKLKHVGGCQRYVPRLITQRLSAAPTTTHFRPIPGSRVPLVVLLEDFAAAPVKIRRMASGSFQSINLEEVIRRHRWAEPSGARANAPGQFRPHRPATLQSMRQHLYCNLSFCALAKRSYTVNKRVFADIILIRHIQKLPSPYIIRS